MLTVLCLWVSVWCGPCGVVYVRMPTQRREYSRPPKPRSSVRSRPRTSAVPSPHICDLAHDLPPRAPGQIPNEIPTFQKKTIRTNEKNSRTSCRRQFHTLTRNARRLYLYINYRLSAQSSASGTTPPLRCLVAPVHAPMPDRSICARMDARTICTPSVCVCPMTASAARAALPRCHAHPSVKISEGSPRRYPRAAEEPSPRTTRGSRSPCTFRCRGCRARRR